ncbi:unnamed protein product [Rotaria magnacalcarata]
MFQHPFYPHQQNQQTFPNNRGPTNHFMPTRPMFFRSSGHTTNQSTHNLNFNRDFERFSMPRHGFTSIPPGRNQFFDFNTLNFEQQQRWRQNTTRTQQQKHRRTPAFHFQDKATSYFMTDPIKTSDNRITIQLTKVHIGPNGDQQRVFVEQEFSNEKELNKFVRNLRQNFEKTFNNRSSDHNRNTDDSNSADTKKPGVVVVEEPDEEPKIYQQQAYNANIESKAAAASLITPPMSPAQDEVPQTQDENHSRTSSPRHRRTKHASPSVSQLSSASTARSNRRRKNKMKYRRQKLDNRDEPKPSRACPMPNSSRQYPVTPTPPRFQQRFFPRDHPFQMKSPFAPPTNLNFQWKYNPNGYLKARSRSFVPTVNDNLAQSAPTAPRFQHMTDPFFQSMHAPKFTRHRPKEFHLPPSPTKFHRSHRRKSNQPTTITENIVYPPNQQQQQPRVQRTKSDSRHFENKQRHRSQSTTNHFQHFSPLQQQPIIHRHFTPFQDNLEIFKHNYV